MFLTSKITHLLSTENASTIKVMNLNCNKQEKFMRDARNKDNHLKLPTKICQ